MAKWGNADYQQLKDLQKRLNDLEKVDMDAFCISAAKELAARLLAKVIKRTPVGQYPAGSGKIGGTLRRGWTGGTSGSGSAYARNLPIGKSGNTYEVVIKNPVHYASYVEFGHRTANHSGWVDGRFMMTKSEIELEAQMPGLLEKKLNRFLKEQFSGD